MDGQPGDTVKVNQTVVEIETAKSLVELPSPVRGRGRRAAACAEGTTVDVGSPIITVDDRRRGAPAAVPRHRRGDDMAPAVPDRRRSPPA